MLENKNIIIAMIIIGIVVLILLVSPTLSHTTFVYRPALTASTARLTPDMYYRKGSGEYYYTVHRYIPQQYNSPPPTYTYTSSTTGYEGETMFSDGCTMTSPYSLTTGEPCS